MKNDRIYVIDDENGEPIITNAEDYLNYILRIIRNTPNDQELGKTLRNEYDMLKLSLLILFSDDIDEDEEIPY